MKIGEGEVGVKMVRSGKVLAIKAWEPKFSSLALTENAEHSHILP